MMVGLGCLARLIGLFPSGVAVTRGERRFSTVTWLLPVPMAIGLLANEDVLVEPVTYGGIGPFANPAHVDALGWLLVLSTLVSMADRAWTFASSRRRSPSPGRGAPPG